MRRGYKKLASGKHFAYFCGLMKTLATLLLASLLPAALLADEKGSAKKGASPKGGKQEATEPAVPAAAQKAADSLTPAQDKKLLEVLNKGTADELSTLPGIGETRAAAISKARPIKKTTDLLAVNGVGEVTFVEIVAHAKAGFPVKEPTDSKGTPKAKKGTGKSKGTKKSE